MGAGVGRCGGDRFCGLSRSQPGDENNRPIPQALNPMKNELKIVVTTPGRNELADRLVSETEKGPDEEDVSLLREVENTAIRAHKSISSKFNPDDGGVGPPDSSRDIQSDPELLGDPDTPREPSQVSIHFDTRSSIAGSRSQAVSAGDLSKTPRAVSHALHSASEGNGITDVSSSPESMSPHVPTSSNLPTASPYTSLIASFASPSDVDSVDLSARPPISDSSLSAVSVEPSGSRSTAVTPRLTTLPEQQPLTVEPPAAPAPDTEREVHFASAAAYSSRDAEPPVRAITPTASAHHSREPSAQPPSTPLSRNDQDAHHLLLPSSQIIGTRPNIASPHVAFGISSTASSSSLNLPLDPADKIMAEVANLLRGMPVELSQTSMSRELSPRESETTTKSVVVSGVEGTTSPTSSSGGASDSKSSTPASPSTASSRAQAARAAREAREAAAAVRKRRDQIEVELMSSETEYHLGFNSMRLHYLRPMKNVTDLVGSATQIKDVFGNIEAIAKLSEDLYNDFAEDLSSVIPTIARYAPSFNIYIAYAENFPRALAVLNELSGRKKFAEFLKVRYLLGASTPLLTYLMLPFARLDQYVELLSHLLECMPPEDSLTKSLVDALTAIKTIAAKVAEHRADADNLNHLFDTMNPVTSTANSSSFTVTRRDLRSGKLRILNTKPQSARIEKSESKLTAAASFLLMPHDSETKLPTAPSFSFFLFPGWLTWTNDRYQLQGQLELNVQRYLLRNTEDNMAAFEIIDPRDQTIKLCLECDTLSDKEGWMGALQKAIDAIWPTSATSMPMSPVQPVKLSQAVTV